MYSEDDELLATEAGLLLNSVVSLSYLAVNCLFLENVFFSLLKRGLLSSSFLRSKLSLRLNPDGFLLSRGRPDRSRSRGYLAFLHQRISARGVARRRHVCVRRRWQLVPRFHGRHRRRDAAHSGGRISAGLSHLPGLGPDWGGRDLLYARVRANVSAGREFARKRGL